jgi:hypothetical protein
MEDQTENVGTSVPQCDSNSVTSVELEFQCPRLMSVEDEEHPQDEQDCLYNVYI